MSHPVKRFCGKWLQKGGIAYHNNARAAGTLAAKATGGWGQTNFATTYPIDTKIMSKRTQQRRLGE